MEHKEHGHHDHGHHGTLEEIRDHFEEIAPKYDWHKERAWYYYDWLKKICKIHIPNANQQKILELGCGTGDVLAFLNPRKGLGIDVSKKMIEIANKKHGSKKNLKFEIGAGETLKTKDRFDVILMPDVIEHLADVAKTFTNISKASDSNTRTIITMINPIWEPILMWGEKRGKKMPEGPHNRITYGEMKRLLQNVGLKVAKRRFYVFIPVYIPFISNPFNYVFNRLPMIRRLGLIEVIEIVKG